MLLKLKKEYSDANAWSANQGNGNGWFKIQRTGNTFISYVSADGVNWNYANSNTLANFSPSNYIYAGVFAYALPEPNPNIYSANFDYFSLTGTNVTGPASLLVSPATNAVVDGLPATFSAAMIGPIPAGYQWQLNGTNIAGATNATLTIPAASTGSPGYTYTWFSGASATCTSDTTTGTTGTATTAGASDRVRVPPAKELMVVAPVGQGWAWVGWLYGMSLPTMVWPAARPMTLGTLVMVLPPADRVPVRAATTLQDASVTTKDMVSPPDPLKVEPWDMVMVPPEMPAMVDPGRMPWPATGAPRVSPRMDETSVMEKLPLLTLPVKEIP